jgi:dTDP-glucose 4,6-dehydratase
VKVLITGGAGFLGSHLCDFLISKGCQVICLDNLITGSMFNIQHLENIKNFEFCRVDVSESITLEQHFDYVLHFASLASPTDYLKFPIETMKAGASGTFNTLELAKTNGAKFLLASTSEVYGDPLQNPQTENYWGNVNPIGPRSVYDESKRFAEALTSAYHRCYGVDTRIARIFNTYGPRMRKNDGRAIPNLVSQALTEQPLTVFGDGSQTRSFCFVSDLMEGLWNLMLSNVNDPVNLGNPEERTIIELTHKILELTGSKSPIMYENLPVDDPKVRKPDISRARKLLGWQPRIGLDEGLRKTIEWFRQPMQRK